MFIKCHTSFLGHSGYNAHARSFFTALNKFCNVKVRNFSYDANKEDYLTEELKDMLVEQSLTDQNNNLDVYPFEWDEKIREYDYDAYIVLNEVNHYYFYDPIVTRPAIGYNVWESTRYPKNFLKEIHKFDQFWVPTKWQAQCLAQEYPVEKIRIIPEAVNPDCYYKKTRKFDKFTFFLAGRWDYRKSTKEIIETFLDTFKTKDVQLIISVDNPYSIDGLKSTEDRLDRFKLSDPRIQIVHFPDRNSYLSLIRRSHVILSCSRSEGWGIPILEGLACGVPTTYTNWGAPLEFAKGYGVPIDVIGEKSAALGEGGYGSFDLNFPGNYVEPDFGNLSKKMKDLFNNIQFYDQKAVDSAKHFSKYSWEKVAAKAYRELQEIVLNHPKPKLTFLRFEDNERKIIFSSNEDYPIKCHGLIRDGATGVNYYRTPLTLKPDFNYSLIHGYDVDSKDFLVYDKHGNQLLNVPSKHGEHSIADKDVLGCFKNFIYPLYEDSQTALPLYEIFVDEIYRKGEIDIHEGDIVFDIGANVGFFSYYAILKGAEAIHSFEPIPEIFEVLNQNFGHFKHLATNNSAVGKEGIEFVYYNKSDTVTSSSLEEEKRADSEKIPCNSVNLMSYIKEHHIERIDFLKIDCEGAEYNIIDSLEESYLQKCVKYIIIEFHHNVEGKLYKMLDKLINCGFTYEIKENADEDTQLGIVYLKKGDITKEKRAKIKNRFNNNESKKILLNITSDSLGDNIAWMPYVEKFRIQSKYDVSVYCPYEDIFKSEYKELNFVDKSFIGKAKRMINLGYEPENPSAHRVDPRTIPLQQVAADTLGLDYEPIRPKLKTIKVRTINGKYVCIATQSTAQCKYWNNPYGWDDVCKYLKKLGYRVICIDKAATFGIKERMNTIPEEAEDFTGDIPLESRISDLYYCDFFIGLASGLSWLSWALNKPTIVISGFSDPISEFPNPHRIINRAVCNSCWNDSLFDRNNWLWCPRGKNFECSKEISSKRVIQEIDQVITSL